MIKNVHHFGLLWQSSRIRLLVSSAGDVGSIPGQRTKIPHAEWHGKKYIYTYFYVLVCVGHTAIILYLLFFLI